MKQRMTLLVGISLFVTGCGGDAPSDPAVGSQGPVEPATSNTADDDTLPPVPPEPAPARERLGLVISVVELQERLESDPPRILDVRAADTYGAGHVPAAVHVDLQDWKPVSLSADGLDNPDHWSERIGQLGIDADTQVVVYAGNPTDAARVWWILKYVGIGEVAMLDGGWDAWLASGAATTEETPDIAPVAFTPDFQTERLARMQELTAGDSTATVIDTRSDAEFNGTGGPGERHGHIPGAVHIEWSEFMTDDGRFRSKEEIQALLSERGIEPGSDEVVHCQSGGRASFAALALELAGYGTARNYYCGWSEWSASEDAPVETETVSE